MERSAMSTPVTQMPKPDARQYEGNRKLFLVPVYLLGSDAPEEGQRLLEQYWSEVRGHVDNLERSLGKVVHVYHEAVFAGGEQGMAMVEAMNPTGYSFVQAICQSGATLEAAEDGDLVHESSDWQRCISVGLMSQKVLTTAMEGFQEATRLRYESLGKGIDETLKGSESGILFIREDHRVQFPAHIQVFYVAPPALDALNRWRADQMRAATRLYEEMARQESGAQDAEAEAPHEQEAP